MWQIIVIIITIISYFYYLVLTVQFVRLNTV